MTRHAAFWALAACAVASSSLIGAEPGPTPSVDPSLFATHIRTTDPLPGPEQEKVFHLPKGFRIQLFAAEPEIQKPMNLAFDARGRLWVSGSTEYPYPVEAERPGQDSIRILEDTDGDGRADSSKTFVDGLNIPIGLYPYRNGVIAFSIPNIWYFEDLDGDDRCDRKTVLYGPFDYKGDTHGLNNAFRRGFDGWIYACHGWANRSTIAGKDGHKVAMQGGNTYRFKPDGGRIEHFTWGQVNPFGMAIDSLGDIYNADCHTSPVTLLMRGGYFESFGKPHDGLGFVPPVMRHSHGSSAIAGTVIYSASDFPDEFRGNAFTGNVMTSRVNRDSFRRIGSSVVADEEPDFVVCDDPWFRPVDLQLGPDGALYVADFYNRIIGHYEVPLDHPGRDRVRGRIWKITYVGDTDAKPQSPADNLRETAVDGLIQSLATDNLTLRMRATDELSDRVGADAVEPVKQAIASARAPTTVVQGLWILQRLGAIDAGTLEKAAAHSDSTVRIHAIKTLSERSNCEPGLVKLAIAALNDPEPLVRRAACDALGQQASVDATEALLHVLDQAPSSDVHLRHAARIALRNQLANPERLALVARKWPREKQALAVDLAQSIPTPEAASFIVDALQRGAASTAKVPELLTHVAKHLPNDRFADLIRYARSSIRDDLGLQVTLFHAVDDGLKSAGIKNMPELDEWGGELATGLLASIDAGAIGWKSIPTAGTVAPQWVLEQRATESEGERVPVLSSLPLGEQFTGTLRSKPFEIPAHLKFYIVGHLGHPNSTPDPRNFVQLRLKSSGEVIAKELAPKSDAAHLIEWNLEGHAGELGSIEIVDGVDQSMYAWLAAGEFEPEVVGPPSVSPQEVGRRLTAAAELAARLGRRELLPQLKSVVTNDFLDSLSRAAAAQAIAALIENDRAKVLADLVGDEALNAELREKVCGTLAADVSDCDELLAEVMRTAPKRVQMRLAENLCSTGAGAVTLLSLIEGGVASPTLLQSASLANKISVSLPSEERARLTELTAKLPAGKAEVDTLISDRSKKWVAANASSARGHRVFSKHCAVCHQFQKTGATIGPQLDGIGTRGVERLMEDMLDPSRNIDAAFKTTVFVTDSGLVLTGLLRREAGEAIVIADNQGKETTVAKAEITEQHQVPTSIMPDNFATLLSESEMVDLVGYLLSDQTSVPGVSGWTVVTVDSRFRSEGVSIGDVNRDGKPDILAGEFWYEAPSWTPHEIDLPNDYGDGSGSLSKCFFSYASDVDRDGWTDQIVIGLPGEPCYWYRNPAGEAGHWKKHEIWHNACNETPLFVDLFQNGQPVLVMAWQPAGSTNQGQMAWFTPGADPTAPWTMHRISAASTPEHEIPGTQRFSHGLGVGDIDGDKRLDVICTAGWWKQPDDPNREVWDFEPAPLGKPCANMCVADINADSLADVLTSSAHEYGIWAHAQVLGEDGTSRSFQQKDLFPDLLSQTHALHAVDLDRDGVTDLVTGKRWWAHGPSGDPGSDEPAVLYWFRGEKHYNGSINFRPILIHSDSGVGTQFSIGDLNGDGQHDIVTSNKKGVHAFIQRASATVASGATASNP